VIPLRPAILAALLLFLHGLTGSFAADPAIPATVKTNFAPEAILSPAELATVIKLATECGLPGVAEVSTFNNYHPSPFTAGATLACPRFSPLSQSKISRSAGQNSKVPSGSARMPEFKIQNSKFTHDSHIFKPF